MFNKINRCAAMSALVAAGMFAAGAAPAAAADMTFTLATSGTETDMRSVAMAEVLHQWSLALRTIRLAIMVPCLLRAPNWKPSSCNLTMSTFRTGTGPVLPGVLNFATGYVHQDAAHQVAVFNNPLMDPFKQKVEDELGVKLLSVCTGRRHVNLRFSRDEKNVMTPADLAGVNLRMPGTDAWQFLGRHWASPTPLAFNEVYTALSTGAVDGQDNPLPTVVDKKFYEVTKQISMTSHLVDLNYRFLKGDVGQPVGRPEDDGSACRRCRSCLWSLKAA